MNPLDEPIPSMDHSMVSLWPTIFKYGLIGGGIVIIYALANFYITSLSVSYSSTTVISILGSIFMIIVYTLVMIFGVKEYRDKKNGGFINLGKGMLIAFGSAMIMGTIGLIFNLLYLFIIDPEFLDRSLRNANGNLPPSLSPPADVFSPGLIFASQISSFVMGAIVGVFIALIVALIMKRDRPVWTQNYK